MSLVAFEVLVFAAASCIAGIPGYVIAKRRGLARPGIAFIPFIGLWIIVFESMGRSGWYAFLVLIPYLGLLAVSIWTAIRVPDRHGRSRWWIAALVVPGLNLIGYWAYALTLPREQMQLQPAI